LAKPIFQQINLVVRNMNATVAFYRRLGLEIEVIDEDHVDVELSNGTSLEFDSPASVECWDSGWGGSTGGSNILTFALPSREEVDAVYADLTAYGYRGRQRPHDAFWGARYAIVEDPDGNGVGLTSPRDRASAPPTPLAPG